MILPLLLVLYIVLCSPIPLVQATDDSIVVLRESAKGSRTLPPFTVKHGWELRWDAKGDQFSVSLYMPNGEFVDTLATQRKPGAGSTIYPKGGTYYLRIISAGDWTISATQLPLAID